MPVWRKFVSVEVFAMTSSNGYLSHMASCSSWRLTAMDRGLSRQDAAIRRGVGRVVHFRVASVSMKLHR